MTSLENIEEFMRFLHKVQNVMRVARIPDETECRSTAEHTFELTLLCWYLMSTNKLDLDQDKVIKYALAHDLIEGYAGDTYIYDKASLETKKEREAAALLQLEETFKEFPELIETIHAYEKKEDPESRFVYAADKFIDPLNLSMETKESFWKVHNVSYDDVRSYKDHKIALSEHIQHYWTLLLQKIETRKDFFFHS